MKLNCTFSAVFLFIILLIFGSQVIKGQYSDNVYDLPLSELLKIQFYSANRELTNVSDVQAVVTVITAEDLKSSGAKNLTEVLSRVPGFFMESSYGAIVTQRGMAVWYNQAHLLLIDGHLQHQTTRIDRRLAWPTLNNVKQIEVIRSPGSTLWGSDAVLGVINVITYTGAEIDEGENKKGTINVFVDYEMESNLDIETLQYGKKFNNRSSLITSFTHWKRKTPYTTVHTLGETGPIIREGWYNANLRANHSYDIYARYLFSDWELRGRLSDAEVKDVYNDTWEQIGNNRNNFAELRYTPEFGAELKMENRIFYDYNNDENNLYMHAENNSFYGGDLGQNGLGLESIIKYKTENNKLMTGVFGSSMQLKKLDRIRLKPDTVLTPVSSNIIYDDRNWGIFVEYTWMRIENFAVTLGLRYEGNKGRDGNSNFLPKLAASYNINNNWSIKYNYSTGYLRPSAGILPGNGYALHPSDTLYIKQLSKPAESKNHDLQTSFIKDRFAGIVTIFYQEFDNGYGLVGYQHISNNLHNGLPVVYFFGNIFNASTRGVEIEAKWNISGNYQVYTNYSYSYAEHKDRYPMDDIPDFDMVEHTSHVADNLRITNSPAHMWNLGFNFDLNNKLSSNIHYSGWSDAVVKYSLEPSFKSMGPEHFLSINMNYKPREMIQVGAYVKNVFDNVGPFPIGTGKAPYSEAQIGRQIGASLRLKW